MKRIAVILSGCGVFDGAEIHESVLTLLEIDLAGAKAVCCAPNIEQSEVINFIAKTKDSSQKRNVLVESARIARGNIKVLEELKMTDFDAVILPGGFGAAKNLSSYANSPENYTVNSSVEAFLKAAHKASKPIGFICIAPVIAAKLFGSSHVKLTIGNDASTAAHLEKLGAVHTNTTVEDIVVDDNLKIVTTAGYMLASSISELQHGISKLVGKIVSMI